MKHIAFRGERHNPEKLPMQRWGSGHNDHMLLIARDRIPIQKPPKLSGGFFT